MTTSTLTPTGQVTIPEEIREQLGLVGGTLLRIEVDPRGVISLCPIEGRPKVRRSQVRGLLRHLAKDRPVTVEEMDEAIAAEAVARFRRSTSR